MTAFIIQSFLLLAIAYILGCMFGSLFHRWFGEEKASEEAPVVAPEKVKEIKSVVVEKADTEPAFKPVAFVVEKPEETPVFVASAKDDLKRIRGIGPQNEVKLNSIDVTTFAQISKWSADEQAEIGERLAFPGRIERENWVEQAKVLAAGGETDFAKRVDKGEVSSSTGAPNTASIGEKPQTFDKAPSKGNDNLTLINGVGGALEKKLFAIGVYKFDQIAGWNAEHQAWIGNELGFPGRPERENWVTEAKKLADGNVAAEAPKKGGVEIAARKK